MNIEMDENYCLKVTENIIKQVVAKDDEHTKQVMKEYAMQKSKEIGEKINMCFIDKEIVDEIIELGIQEYSRRHNHNFTTEDIKGLVEAVYLHNSNTKNTVCCIEEMSELTKVLTKFLRESPKFNKADLTEELSHVLLLCNVMIRQHGLDKNDILEHQRRAVNKMYENK